jgi:PAS domain S-box-containing protein
MAEKTPEHKDSDAAHHAAREALRESEVKYRSLFENSLDAIMTLDPIISNFTSCNPATLKVFGVGTFDKFVSVGPINLSPERQPDGRLSAEKAREMIATAMRAKSHSFEWTHRRLNGEEFFADVQLTRIDQDGKATILATVKDITARKLAEQAVQESEERYRRLFEVESDAILLVDRETGRLMDANPSALKLYCYTRQEFLSLKHSDVSAEPERTSQAIAEGQRFVANRRHRKSDGTIFPVEICGNYFDLRGRKMHVAAIRDLTAQQQAEEKLRKSESELNRAQAIAHVGSWSWDCQSGLVAWSAEMYRIYGVTPKTFDHTFNDLARLIHPDDLPRQLKSHEAIAQGRAFDPFEYRVIRPDGSIRVVQVFSAETERNAAGQPIRLFGAVQDITEGKRTEENLVILTQALDSTHDAVGISDVHGRHFYQNKAFTDLYGYATAEELQAAGGGAATVKDPEVCRELFEKIMSGKSWAGELELVTKSGRVFTGYERADAITDNEGKQIGLIGIITDITERKRAEEATRTLANIVESSNDAIIGETLDGIVTSWNRAAEKIFGYTAAEMIGRSVTLLLPSDRVMEERDILGHVIEGDGVRSLETRRVRKDGVQIDVVATVSPIKDGQGRIVGASKIGRDITRRKRAELEVEQTHNQLLAASRQSGMAEFATGVLHNVGNVLNSVNIASACVSDSLRKSKSANLKKVVALIRQHEADLGAFFTHDPKGKILPGYLAQLSDHLAGEQAAALEELGQLQQNIEHIKSIITVQQDSANLSHSQEALKPADMVEDALKLNANGLRTNGVHVIKDFEEMPTIMAEKHKVLQILVNLVRNAMQALEESNNTEKRVTIRVCQDAGRARIAITDTGGGIRPENLPRIFAHGFTTKKNGHGFGLHSAALAAKEMGGTLTVQSDGPNRGATFVLELPMQN